MASAVIPGRAFPIPTFLEELDVSLATFKRDLEYLRDRLYAPIVWDREQNGTLRNTVRERVTALTKLHT